MVEEASAPWRKNDRGLRRGDFDDCKERPSSFVNPCPQPGELIRFAHRPDLAEPRGPRHTGEIHSTSGMRLLSSRLSVDLVIEDDDGEVPRALNGDGSEASQAHEHFAVGGHDEDPARRLRESEPEPDRRREPHRSPEVEAPGIVTHGSAIPRGASETGHEE